MINVFMAPDGRLRPIWRFMFSIMFVILAPAFIAQWIIGSPIENDLTRDIVVTCSTAVLALLSSMFLLHLFDEVRGGPRQLLRELGFVRNRVILDVLLGLMIGFVLITMAVLAIALFGGIRPARVPITLQTGGRALLISGWLLVAAASEEIQFRLYPFRELRDSIGTIAAAGVMSLMFGAVHQFNPNFGKLALLNTALIGGLLAMVYVRTRTVWMIWAIHFGWNFALGVVYGLPVSGFSFAVVVKSTTVGHRWLTGGRYGIEASITGAAVTVCGYVIAWFVTAPRARELARLHALREREQLSPSAIEFDAPAAPGASNQ